MCVHKPLTVVCAHGGEACAQRLGKFGALERRRQRRQLLWGAKRRRHLRSAVDDFWVDGTGWDGMGWDERVDSKAAAAAAGAAHMARTSAPRGPGAHMRLYFTPCSLS